MTTKDISTLIPIATGIALTLGFAHAGIITVANLADDETQVINTGGTLISAVNFGRVSDGTTDRDINGLLHKVSNTHNAPQWDLVSGDASGNASFTGRFRDGKAESAGLTDDLRDLVGTISGAPTLTFEVFGLTAGKEYLFQTYWEADDQAELSITFEGADTQNFTDNTGSPDVAKLISYTFTAGDDTLNVTFDDVPNDNNVWLSGYSLQEIPDLVDPELVTTHPLTNAIYVDPSDDLVATFDSTVQPGIGNISIFTAADDLVEQFDVNDVTAPGTVIFNGSTVIISPTTPLMGGTGYYVLIDATAVEDLSNNTYTGISDKMEWSFTASSITAHLVNDETDIVNTGGTVVSAVHFQNGSTGTGATDPNPLVVNGISHTVGIASEANLTYGGSGNLFEGDFRNGETGLPEDGSNLIQVLYSGIAGRADISMSLSGLTVGEEYLFQVYWEANNLGAVLEVTIEGETQDGLVPMADKQTNPGGTVISYRFTAGDDTLNASFARTDSVTNDWLSGYSLQSLSTADTPYADWASGQVPPLTGGFNDDDDQDGTLNGHEFYYFDSDPNAPEGLGSPVTGATKTGASTFEFTHNRRIDRDDVTETYLWSSDLVNWYVADGLETDGTNTVTAAIDTVVAGPNANLETVTAVATIGGPEMTKLFVRQELTSP